MLLNEVGQDQADWYLIAKDGNLTVRVSDGLCIGEDESGLLLLNPKPADALIMFSVDAWGCLRIQPASDAFALLSPQRNHCTSYRVEPYQGLGLWLPNNKLDLANDLQGITNQYNDLPLTLVTQVLSPNALTNAERRTEAMQVDELNAAPVPESISEDSEILVQEPEIPVLDSPIERIPEPELIVEPELIAEPNLITELDLRVEPDRDADANPTAEAGVATGPVRSETLITALPYGFDRKDFTTSHPAAVLEVPAKRTHGFGRSSRITAVAMVILIGIAAGLLTAKLDLIEYPLRANEPRTAFNPATPRLVLLSEAQTAATAAPAEVPDDAQPPAPDVPLLPPETTPATPTVRQGAQSTSEPASASVYRTDLADATALFDQGYITAPAQRNTVAILSRILAEDPTHREATLLLERCAERMLNAAVQAEQHGLEFEARNLVEEVMAFFPGHPQATNLWQQWVASQDA